MSGTRCCRSEGPDDQTDRVRVLDPLAIDDSSHGNLQSRIGPKERRIQRTTIEIRQVELPDKGRNYQDLRDVRA